jgi:hypothetical protein
MNLYVGTSGYSYMEWKGTLLKFLSFRPRLGAICGCGGSTMPTRSLRVG